MLILSDWNGKTIHVENYTWDAGVECFKCELKDVDVGLIKEAVKGGRGSSWMSTSPSGSHPHNVDITIYEDNPLVGGQDAIKFQCFVLEVWESEGYNVKFSGKYWGAPNTWKGYEDYVRHSEEPNI